VTSPPRLDRPPVELPTFVGALGAVWEAILALTDAVGDLPWTVVGGQMVFLHAAETGVDVHRVSADIDAAVDLRADPAGLKKLVAALVALGFEPTGQSPEGHAHRFERTTAAGVAAVDVAIDSDDAAVQVDVLAPEGLGPKTDLRTVGTGTAFPAEGVTQALARTELVPVRAAGAIHWVPRPNLLGAIVGKATAITVDHVDTDRHRQDLAFLCGLVSDPFTLAEHVDKTDRKRLRVAAAVFGADHPGWRFAPVPADAQIVLETLIGD
jgi:hypothetical protein